jgi:uncharacterized protein YukE
MKRLLSRQLVFAEATVVIVLLGAACGGGGGSTTTSAEAAQDWANGLCTATNTYVSSLTSLGNTLKNGNLTKSSLDQALDKAKSATQTFGDDVKALGSPPVSDSKAKDILGGLQDDLAKDADTIKGALSDVSNVTQALTAVSTVTATLATLGTQISSAYSQLKDLDDEDTIKSAFQDAPACSSLIGS